MTDLVERVHEVLPSVRRDLEALVRIESVWADPNRRTEVQRSAESVAKLLSQAGFDDVQIVSEGGAPAVIARHPAPRPSPPGPPPRPAPRRYCCTPITTYSPKASTVSGSRRRSSRPSATAGCTVAAVPTTRQGSQRIWRRSGLMAVRRPSA